MRCALSAHFCAPKIKAHNHSGLRGYIMETAGFEPRPEGPDTNLSTCVVYISVSHNERS